MLRSIVEPRLFLSSDKIFSLLGRKFIFRIRGIEWSCKTDGGSAMFLSWVFQDYRISVCAQLLVMIMIPGRLALLGFVFKPVSWLAGDSRLRQTCILRIHLVERRSLSPNCPSTISLLASGA